MLCIVIGPNFKTNLLNIRIFEHIHIVYFRYSKVYEDTKYIYWTDIVKKRN